MSKEFKVVVGGGRFLHDKDFVYAVLDRFHAQHGFTRLAHGDCRGADKLAEKWARERGVHAEPYPALWDEHGRGAGPRRNRYMLKTEQPNLVITFPGGSGTEDLIAKAAEFGLRVVRCAKTKAIWVAQENGDEENGS